jgi:hypothetical protein
MAVPDQRRTTPLRFVLRRVRDTRPSYNGNSGSSARLGRTNAAGGV